MKLLVGVKVVFGKNIGKAVSGDGRPTRRTDGRTDATRERTVGAIETVLKNIDREIFQTQSIANLRDQHKCTSVYIINIIIYYNSHYLLLS